MVELVRESRPKARKAHRCDLCDGIIEKGVMHVALVCTDAGCIYTWRAEIECYTWARNNFDWLDWEERTADPDFKRDMMRS